MHNSSVLMYLYNDAHIRTCALSSILVWHFSESRLDDFDMTLIVHAYACSPKWKLYAEYTTAQHTRDTFHSSCKLENNN